MGTALEIREKARKIVVSEVEPVNVLRVVEMLQKSGFTARAFM